MGTVFFLLFVILLAATLVRGIARPQRFFEYPYFMAGIFAIFILPQAISLRSNPGGVPLESIPMVLLMTLLCLAAGLLGYRLPANRLLARIASTPLRLDRLFHVGAAFILVSLFFTYLISRMSAEETGGSMWSGRVTIYHFFAQLVYPGLTIALFTALSKRDPLAWIAVGIAAIGPLQSIIFSGRREGAAIFILIVAGSLFYHRRFVPPRFAVVGALAFGMLAIPATSAYRSLMETGEVAAIRDIDLVANFERFLEGEAILELRNAAAIVFATKLRGNYQNGSAYWDELVWRFVPAQVFGAEFKNGLMFAPRLFETKSKQATVDMGLREYRLAVGSTITGMADSFQQFGYFGCLFFALLAVVFRSLWESSLRSGAYFARLLYILSITSAMRAVTHQTVDFLPGFLYHLVFLGMAFVYARERRPHVLAAIRSRRQPDAADAATPRSDQAVNGDDRSNLERPLAPARKRDLADLD